MPTMFSLMISGMYSVMDGLFIGRAAGDMGLAAVNLAWPIPAVITAVGIGIGTGGSVLYSTARGRGEQTQSEYWYRFTLKMLVVSGILVEVLLSIGYPGILDLLGARGEVYRQAARYSRIIAGGCLFQILGAGMVPVLRNRGMAFGAMVSMTTGMLANLALNYVLIFVAGLGIAGAAIGTVTAQGIVAAIGSVLLYVQAKRGRMKSAVREIRCGDPVCADGHVSVSHPGRKIMKAGVSAFGLSLAPSVVLIFTNYRCLQYGGDAGVACYAVISYITFPVQYILAGIGDGSQPLMSYYNGCGKLPELEFIQQTAKQFAVGIGVVLMLAVWMLIPWIPALFGMSETAVQYFEQGMRISSLAFLFMGTARFHIAYMGAALRVKEASALVYGETLIVSPMLLLLLPEALGMTGIWWSFPAVQIVMLVIFNICFTRRALKI